MTRLLCGQGWLPQASRSSPCNQRIWSSFLGTVLTGMGEEPRAASALTSRDKRYSRCLCCLYCAWLYLAWLPRLGPLNDMFPTGLLALELFETRCSGLDEIVNSPLSRFSFQPRLVSSSCAPLDFSSRSLARFGVAFSRCAVTPEVPHQSVRT
jgi:hypothetical protein